MRKFYVILIFVSDLKIIQLQFKHYDMKTDEGVEVSLHYS
jgi:hypothetical protein